MEEEYAVLFRIEKNDKEDEYIPTKIIKGEYDKTSDAFYINGLVNGISHMQHELGKIKNCYGIRMTRSVLYHIYGSLVFNEEQVKEQFLNDVKCNRYIKPNSGSNIYVINSEGEKILFHDADIQNEERNDKLNFLGWGETPKKR